MFKIIPLNIKKIKQMNKLTSLFALIFCLNLNAQDLNVMTFNIRLALDIDKENAWQHRRNDVLKLLNYYGMDVLGVQEAVPQQMTDLKNGLEDYDYVGVGRDDGQNKGEYSAIFFNTEKLTVLQSGTFWLSETPDQPSKGWDAAYNRVCTFALFKTKKGGKKFWAFNVHFDHVGNLAREESAKLILKKIKEFNKGNLPVVLTGDFNLTEDTAPLRLLSENLQNTYRKCAKTPYGPHGTFTAFDVNKIPTERIDYIFTQKLQCQILRTINDRRENLRYPSDHFPVMATLKFK